MFPVRIFRRAGSKLDLLGETVQEVEHTLGDITDDLALQKAMQGVECVYHVAGNIGFGSSRVRNRLMSVNVDGTAAVVNAALAGGVRRLVHASSVAALGRSNRPDALLDENAEWQRSKSSSTYGYSKYLAELEVKRGVAEGLDAVMVNPSLIFGLGRKGENTRRIVDQIRRKKMPMFPAGVTSVVDVLDVADGMVRAMKYGETGERFVLAGHNLSWEETLPPTGTGMRGGAPDYPSGAGSRYTLRVFFGSRRFPDTYGTPSSSRQCPFHVGS